MHSVETKIKHDNIRYRVYTSQLQNERWKTTIHRTNLAEDHTSIIAEENCKHKFEAMRCHSQYVELIG